jgi:hypothetical protein
VNCFIASIYYQIGFCQGESLATKCFLAIASNRSLSSLGPVCVQSSFAYHSTAAPTTQDKDLSISPARALSTSSSNGDSVTDKGFFLIHYTIVHETGHVKGPEKKNPRVCSRGLTGRVGRLYLAGVNLRVGEYASSLSRSQVPRDFDCGFLDSSRWSLASFKGRGWDRTQRGNEAGDASGSSRFGHGPAARKSLQAKSAGNVRAPDDPRPGAISCARSDGFSLQ